MQHIVQKDTAKRREYLDTAFTQVILDAQSQIQEWQAKVLMGDTKVQDKIAKKEERIRELVAKNLTFEQKSKGIQYFLPMNAWKSKI